MYYNINFIVLNRLCNVQVRGNYKISLLPTMTYSASVGGTSVLVKEKDKVDIIQTMSLHHVILRSKAEIDQFCDGLQACGVLGAVRQHPDLGRPFFTIEGQGHLTTGE